MKSYISAIRAAATPRSFKKGANILFQGEVPRRGMAISSGVVRSYTIASTGDERTIGFYTTDDILPLDWLIDTTSNSLFYYEALSDVRLLQFAKDDFTTHVIGNPEALASLFDTVSKDSAAATIRINGLEQSRAEEKVAFTLYYLLFRYGAEQTNDNYRIGIQLRHAMIASLVGLSRESTTKIIGKFQNDGVLHQSSGFYTVNKTRLERYLGEDSFRDMVLR